MGIFLDLIYQAFSAALYTIFVAIFQSLLGTPV